MRFRLLVGAFALSLFTVAHAEQTIRSAELDRVLESAQAAINDGEYDTAFELYNRAARWGEKGAQYVLGHLYLQGAGVDKDPVTGAAWLQAAAEAPVREYRSDAKDAMKALDDRQKAEAEQLAQRIISSFGMEAANVRCKSEHRVGSNIKQINCRHDNLTAGGLIVVPEDADIS